MQSQLAAICIVLCSSIVGQPSYVRTPSRQQNRSARILHSAAASLTHQSCGTLRGPRSGRLRRPAAGKREFFWTRAAAAQNTRQGQLAAFSVSAPVLRCRFSAFSIYSTALTGIIVSVTIAIRTALPSPLRRVRIGSVAVALEESRTSLAALEDAVLFFCSFILRSPVGAFSALRFTHHRLRCCSLCIRFCGLLWSAFVFTLRHLLSPVLACARSGSSCFI